ncbi:MAG TPA: DUF4260 domain-containing protein [bacterium]|nr:DUF4260 domain-containing protein [bacterium]
MKSLVRLEEFGIFLFSIYLFITLNYPWWLFPLLLLVPDISMIGYAGGNRIGAVVYNLMHFRALGLLLYVIGAVLPMPVVALTGVILFAHATLDRAFGYGLKYGDRFQHTHLGGIGQASQRQEEVSA